MMWSTKNSKNPVIRLFHAALKRIDQETRFKNHCPFCPDGVLAMKRDKKGELMPQDHCLLCGQQVYYVDIKKCREIDK